MRKSETATNQISICRFITFLFTFKRDKPSPIHPEWNVLGSNVIVATSNEFNDLITELKTFQFSEPPTVKVIESNQIITMDKVRSLK